jgi:hypothetical protein
MSYDARYHVFLSYSRHNTDIMHRLRDDLTRYRYSVWTDQGIHAGSEVWQREIEKAIRSADFFVLILTPESVNSEWVRREIGYAQNLRKIIIPLLAGGDETITPFELTNYQFIDIRGRDGYENGLPRLVQAINYYLSQGGGMAPPASPAYSTHSQMPPPARPKGRRPLVIAAVLLLLAATVAGFALLSSNQSSGGSRIIEVSEPPNTWSSVCGYETCLEIPSGFVDASSTIQLEQLLNNAAALSDTYATLLQSYESQIQSGLIDMLLIDQSTQTVIIVAQETVPIAGSLDNMLATNRALFEQMGMSVINSAVVEIPAGDALYYELHNNMVAGATNRVYAWLVVEGNRAYTLAITWFPELYMGDIEQFVSAVAGGFRIN